MQTVFLLGNGFDVNLGLKTRYAEFYDYYLNIRTENENVKNKVVVLSVGFMLAKVIEAITCNQPVSAVYDLLFTVK